MKKRSITIPDSEDDVQSSGTSLKNASPLPRRTSMRLNRARLTEAFRRKTAIPDSEDDDDDILGLSSPAAPGKNASEGVKVVIPVKKNESESPSESASRSSIGIPSGDGATGYSTPATSVGAAAAQSDTKQPRARVNASERAQQLRSSAFALRKSARGTKRSVAAFTADDADRNAADATLAHALQMEEYDEPQSKKRKTLRQSLEEMPTDDELDLLPLSASPMSSSELELDSSDSESDVPLATRVGTVARAPIVFTEQGDTTDEEPPTWWEERRARRVS